MTNFNSAPLTCHSYGGTSTVSSATPEGISSQAAEIGWQNLDRALASPEIGDVIMSHKPMLAKTTARPVADRTLAAGSRGPRHDNHSVQQSHELQRARLPGSNLHPITLIALSTVAWFLAVMWLNFIGSPNVGLVLAVVNGIFVMFLTAILLVASLVIDDPRRKHRFITGSLYCFNSYCCRASGGT